MSTIVYTEVMRPRKWTKEDLINAAKKSRSIRQVLGLLGLVEAGGNYVQIKKYLHEYEIDISHFQGRGWNKGLVFVINPPKPLEKILVKNSSYQSHKLKKRLFLEGIKQECCEECGWAARSKDSRIPLELDHINGDRLDNRIKNLRILCPNCHSLKLTHRGKNSK